MNQTISRAKTFSVDLVGHGHVDLIGLDLDGLVGPEHVDLIDLDLDGPEHVDLGTRQKLRRRGKKGKRRRKQKYNKDKKKTSEQGHFSSLGTFRLWPSCSVTVIQINSGTINTIMKVVVDHCTKM